MSTAGSAALRHGGPQVIQQPAGNGTQRRGIDLLQPNLQGLLLGGGPSEDAINLVGLIPFVH